MKINMSHGNGGVEMSEIINDIFIREFKNKWDEGLPDSAVLDMPGGKLCFTTDGFVVKPLFFPGGDIGRLAVCGSVNDILTSGGKPLYMSASFIIEEGAETDVLRKIAASMREAADEAGVFIVTGDTKVVEGSGGVFITTAAVGALSGSALSFKNLLENDAIIVTGSLGDHHACILSQRLGVKNDIKSDAAPLCGIAEALRKNNVPVRAMRDITRGGLATVLNEVAKAGGLRAQIDEARLPISGGVRGLCAILGLDPLYMGNEGVMLIAVPENAADGSLEIIKNRKYGQNASIIGHFVNGQGVVLNTAIGGKRLVPPLSGEGLPRIC